MSTDDKKASAQDLAFTVPQTVLADALAFVVRAAPKKASVPVLTGVLIEGDADGVTVAAFDLDQTRRYDLDGAQVSTPGRLLVNAAKLNEMVKALRKGAQVTVQGKGVKVTLSDGRTGYGLETLPVDDYPALPDMPPAVGMVDAAALLAAVVPVANSAGTDETLQVMTGVHMFSRGARLSLESSDRYRLAVRDLAWVNGVEEFSALVPAATLVDFVKPLPKLDDTVTIGYAASNHDGVIGFEAGPARAMTGLLGGEFPAVRSLIPAKAPVEADVTAKDLIETVGRVKLALASKKSAVILDFTPAGLNVSAGDGAQGTEDVAAEWRGSKSDRGLYLGMNPEFLVDALKSAGGKVVRFRAVDSFKPLIIVPLEDAAGSQPVPGVTHLLMPIKVSASGDRDHQPVPEIADAKAAVEAAKTAAGPNPQPVAKGKRAAGKRATAKPVVKAAEPVAAAAPPAGGLDKTVPHEFVRAVEDGKPINRFTKCLCGTIHYAKVHRGQAAPPAAAPAAPVEAAPVEQATPEPAEADGHVWLAVLGLTARIDGRMTTHATVKGAAEAVKTFGFGKTTHVLVVEGDAGKRMYVATRSRDDANEMHRVACQHGIPVHVEYGEWPPQGAAADNQEGTQVKAQDNEVPPVVAEQGERPFDAKMAAREALAKASVGDFEGAMALVEQGMEADRESGTPHMFRDKRGNEYGWGRIRDGVLAMQVEREIAVEAEADAGVDTAAEGETVEVDADVDAEPDEAGEDEDDEPQADADDADEDDDLARTLRAALADQPDEIIEGAIRGARARAATAATTAQPQAKPATKPATKAATKAATKPATKAAPATKQPVPVVAGSGVNWAKLGMTEPTSADTERVYELPIGTRVRGARKALLDAIDEAIGEGELAERPKVDADKSDRLNKLRVKFTTQARLAMAAGLLDVLAAEVLPEFMPERTNA